MTDNHDEHEREIAESSEDLEQDEDGSGDVDIPIPPEILERLPPEVRERLNSVFASSMTMTIGGMMNPIAAKVTPQHITDMISMSGRESDLEYADRKHSRLAFFIFAGFVITILAALLMFLTYQGNPDLFYEILKVVGYIGGGLGGGFTICQFRHRA